MLTRMCPMTAFNEVIERASHRLELTLPPAQVQSDQRVSCSVKLFNVLLVDAGYRAHKGREWDCGYLQLPCEILIGSESSGKPAPAQCSSVRYSSKASGLIVVQRGDFLSLLHPAKEQRRIFFFSFCKSALFSSIKMKWP